MSFCCRRLVPPPRRITNTLPSHPKLDSITRPPINPQFGGALTDRLHVGGVAISKAPDCDRHHRRRLRIEIVKPPFERAVAGVRNVFLNPNHMVPYTLLNSNPAQLVEHSAEAKL